MLEIIFAPIEQRTQKRIKNRTLQELNLLRQRLGLISQSCSRRNLVLLLMLLDSSPMVRCC